MDMESRDDDILLESIKIDALSTEGMSLEEENRMLKNTIRELRARLESFEQNPLLVADVVSVLSEDEAIIRLNNGNKFCVGISLGIRGEIQPGDEVLVEQKRLVIVKKVGKHKGFEVEQFVIMEKPRVSWEDVGGMDKQIEEIREVIELPLTKPELFEKIGIEPPKGILLYGPPGTGKTLIAKAVANSTNATFIEIVGSELVQKFIGQGAKLVKSLFKLAREKAPSIIFIDEIDAIASTRIEVGTSGEREVQRTFMQLLAEIDGFKPLDNVKVIGATNRPDILDQAIIRPGRLDRLIEIPPPDREGRIQILRIHSRNMPLENVDLEKIADLTDGFTGAELRAVCIEAGYFAIREGRENVTQEDFERAVKKVGLEEKVDGDVIAYIK